MDYEDKPPGFCEDLMKFIMTFISTTAEAIQDTEGSGGLRIMSVAIGTRLWDELESLRDWSMPPSKTGEEKIRHLMDALKSSGAIEGYSFSEEGGHLKVEIEKCFFVPASDRQMEEGLEQPLCPLGGLIVAGLHKTAHMLATLEKVEHDSKTSVSTLTFKLYS